MPTNSNLGSFRDRRWAVTWPSAGRFLTAYGQDAMAADSGGSPAGLHTHAGDQIFYILEGTMTIEVNGQQYEAPPGSLVVFPAGVPHRNWNSGSELTLHLAFNAPLPDPNEPFARPA